MAKRDQIIAVRTTAGEKAEITKRAGGRGKVGAYLRNLGLGRRPAPPEPAEPESPVLPRTPGAIPVDAGTREGDLAPLADASLELIRRHDPNLAAEIEEAQMTDGAARDAFLKRRTIQLVGQGRTTPVARREAEAEWRAR